VIDLMRHYLEEEFGNQGSRTHGYGTQARKAVERARDQIAAVVGARRSEVIFTSGATEANNLALFGGGPGHVVTTAIEHPSVMEPIAELESSAYRVTRIPPTPGGWVDAEQLLAAVRPDTVLVSVMHVNNETGVIQPIAKIAEGLQDSEARFHVDAAQGFGKIAEGLDHPRIDCIGTSAHKIGGPQGVGALIVRRRKASHKLRPLMFGGGQESGLRPGTLPTHLIAGFGLAAELAVREGKERLERAAGLRKCALQILDGYEVNGDLERSSPYILNLSFPGLDSEEVIDAWSDLAAVSNGSACASHRTRCSYVLQAMGVEENKAAGAVRLSWYQGCEQPDFAEMARAIHGRAS
jgi:cysteine desulfurase